MHWALKIELQYSNFGSTEQVFCCINREKMTNPANALYVNVVLAADILYMHDNSHVICKMESEVISCSRE